MAVSALSILILHLSKVFNIRSLWRLPDPRRQLKNIAITFLPPAVALLWLTDLFIPERLFAFPKSSPASWMVVLLVYPILAAYPQEVLFRAFFFHRYGPLFSHPAVLILVNGLSFGLAHILYANWIAPVLASIGGWLFAWRYHRTGSVMAAGIEHALWGNFLFTIGVGWYFYSGALR
jgi:membrane protease YdiL (CAAX protease family)